MPMTGRLELMIVSRQALELYECTVRPALALVERCLLDHRCRADALKHGRFCGQVTQWPGDNKLLILFAISGKT
jgi:hypothetical protein